MAGSADPFFIIGSERSGSNLLRLVLNAHSGLVIPHPPHLLKTLMPLLPLYGDLAADRNFRLLVDDAASLIELHFSPWDVPVDRRRAFEESKVFRHPYGVMAAFYEQYRRAKGKRRWGCKSTFVVHYADSVLSLHPGAKLIHLIRDGRDVAASAKSSVFNRFHPYYVSLRWSREQAAALKLLRTLPHEKIMTVRYEGLCAEPEKAIREICQFLGEDFEPAMLRHFERPESAELASLSASWKECAQPIRRDSVSRYRAELSAGEILAFETAAARELLDFLYPLVNEDALSPARRPSLPRRLGYLFMDGLGMLRENLRSCLRDRNAWLRLRKSLFILLFLRLRRGSRRDR